MAHAVTAHLGLSDFNAATFANNAAVADTFVLLAIALPVTGGSKNALAKQTSHFGLECAVVDRFGLGDLATGPAQNALRRGNPDFNTIEGISFIAGLLTLRVNQRFALNHSYLTYNFSFFSKTYQLDLALFSC
jgi:hypothetical protein